MHRRLAFTDESPAVIAQASHALCHRDLSQLVRGCAMQNERPNLIADPHDLEHALAPAIAGALAVATAGALIQHIRHETAELLAQRTHLGFGHLLLALL